jgi:hypothetical protein
MVGFNRLSAFMVPHVRDIPLKLLPEEIRPAIQYSIPTYWKGLASSLLSEHVENMQLSRAYSFRGYPSVKIVDLLQSN